jgi:hypothetical protein
MDLVNHFVYSVVLYLLARNESFHEISASTFTTYLVTLLQVWNPVVEVMTALNMTVILDSVQCSKPFTCSILKTGHKCVQEIRRQWTMSKTIITTHDCQKQVLLNQHDA